MVILWPSGTNAAQRPPGGHSLHSRDTSRRAQSSIVTLLQDQVNGTVWHDELDYEDPLLLAFPPSKPNLEEGEHSDSCGWRKGS